MSEDGSIKRHASKKKSKSHKSKERSKKQVKELEAIRNNYGSDEDISYRKQESRVRREFDDSKDDSRSKRISKSPKRRRNLDSDGERYKKITEEYSKLKKRHDIEEDYSKQKKRHDIEEDYSKQKKRHDTEEDCSKQKKRHDIEEDYSKQKNRHDIEEDYSKQKNRHDIEEDYSKPKKRHDIEEDNDSFRKYDRFNEYENDEWRKDYREKRTEFRDRKSEHKRKRHDSDIEERTDYQEHEIQSKYPEKLQKSRYQDQKRKSDYRDKEREDHYLRKRERKEEEKENAEYSEPSKSTRKKHRSNSADVVPREENESWRKKLSRNLPLSGEVGKDSPLDDNEPLSKRQKIENINVRTGGAYIPPARLRMMQEKIKDKGSEEYQRIAWEALKKSIVGMTNKVNASNIGEIVPELFKENIIRGRGILARAIMQAQAASPTFTRVYAALVAIINTKFPEIGELILKRLIVQYKRGFRRNDKTVCMTATRFIAHLLNQEVAHEVLILEIVTHLLENPTGDSVEIAISTLKECGKKLKELTARGMRAITDRVRDVLHEGQVDIRVRYMIEVFFAVQKDGFKDFEIIPEDLDLVEEEDKYTHLINLDDAMDAEEMLNVFQFDPLYTENEEKYKAVAKEILEGGSDSEDSGEESDDEEDDEETKDAENQQIIDMTETNIVCLRRKIYLTIQSSLDFEECAHKLLKLELKPGQILEMCYMILDCCAQQRTYEKFFGLLAQRFCQLSKVYVEPFTEIFDNSYKTIHRLETNKLRNVAKFFAHLLYTDAISWMVLANIKLNEEDTTSSSRIFIKILFQELCEYMGLSKLNDRVKDVTLQEAFDGLFPRDHPHNTRFAINFFTSIGLGGLTDDLREHLKNLPKTPAPVEQPEAESSSSSSSSSDSSSSSSSSSSSGSSSDSSSD